MKKEIHFPKIPTPVITLVVYTLGVLTLILCLKHITLLFAPVFFSFVIAYLFNPVVNFFERKTRFARGIIAAVVMITLVLTFTVVLFNVLPYVVDQIGLAAEKIPQTLRLFSEKVRVISDYITRHFSDYIGQIDLNTEIKEALDKIHTDFSSLIGAAFSSLYSILLILLYTVFIPLISYYFLKDAYKVKEIIFGLMPLRILDRARMRVKQMDTILSSFIRGQAIVVLILAVLYSVGLSLVGLPFAVIIGVIAGIGDIIPYMGTIIGFIISMVVGFSYFSSMEKLLLVVLVFAVVKGSENWFFYPKIVGKEVGLHFVWVLVSIVTFSQLFGFWGLLVAIPSAAGFKVYLKDLIDYYKTTPFYKKTGRSSKQE